MNRGYLIALILLAALTSLSLILNAVIIVELLQLRRAARSSIADARTLLTDLTDETLSYTVEVDQQIPISTSVPFNEAVTVPINAVVPISTTIVVPVDLRFTTYKLAVPINTVLPVDMDVTVPFSQTVDVTTAVPIDVDVPVEIDVADTRLAHYLQELDAALQKTEEQLGHPVWQD